MHYGEQSNHKGLIPAIDTIPFFSLHQNFNGTTPVSPLPTILKAISQDGVHTFSCYALFPIKQEQTIDFIKDETDDLSTNARKFIPLRNKLKSHSDWVKYPYYYARDAIRNWAEFTPNNKYGIRPCQVINGVVFANTRNKFQPLELK